MSETGTDATTTAHAEAAATLGEAFAVDRSAVPEHIWRALDDTSGVGMGRIVLRAFLGLVLAALLAGGLAWSAGLIPSPLSLVP